LLTAQEIEKKYSTTLSGTAKQNTDDDASADA
jgi:hypothetical protein